jgi:hypothetical protein
MGIAHFVDIKHIQKRKPNVESSVRAVEMISGSLRRYPIIMRKRVTYFCTSCIVLEGEVNTYETRIIYHV